MSAPAIACTLSAPSPPVAVVLEGHEPDAGQPPPALAEAGGPFLALHLGGSPRLAAAGLVTPGAAPCYGSGMDCPKCGENLTEEASCRSCTECGSTWFTMEQARRYFGLAGVVAPQEIPAPDLTTGRASRWTCPACGVAMQLVGIDEGLVLDQCASCSGLLLESGESLALRSKIAWGREGPVLRQKLALVLQPKGPYR